MTGIACGRPNNTSMRRLSTTSAYHISPCKIIKMKFKNLRIRNEEKIDPLLLESVIVTYHLGGITAKMLHEIFGLGINLARSEMQRMVVRNLILPWSSAKMKNIDHFIFEKEHTKRHKESDYDKIHVLTEEGLRIIENKKYEPINLTDETLYFVDGGMMLPRGCEVKLDKWEKTQEYPLSEISTWFTDEQKKNRGIPDQICGISENDEKKFDDFMREETTLPATSVEVSFAETTDVGVWFIRFLKGNLVQPSKATITNSGYWFAESFHAFSPIDKGIESIGQGKVAVTWRVVPTSEMDEKTEISIPESESDRYVMYSNIDKPPEEWISLGEPTVLTIEAEDPVNFGSFVRFQVIPAPSEDVIENWVEIAMSRVQLPSNRPLVRDDLEKILSTMKEKLLASWSVPGGNNKKLEKQLAELISVPMYLSKERDRGNWLVKYRLDEKEVFSDAL